MSLLFLQIRGDIENNQYSRMKILHVNFKFLQTFCKIYKFVIGSPETCLWSCHLYFFKK